MVFAIQGSWFQWVVIWTFAKPNEYRGKALLKDLDDLQGIVIQYICSCFTLSGIPVTEGHIGLVQGAKPMGSSVQNGA